MDEESFTATVVMSELVAQGGSEPTRAIPYRPLGG
jgi:hypothetical protein